jgi:hypothetical protein
MAEGEDYFKKADETPAYYAAIALDSCHKNQRFHQKWEPHKEKAKRIDGVKKKVKDLWL